MNKDTVINNIIYLPNQFYRQGSTSMYSLLQESGYFELYNQISETDIFELLTQFPECADQWLILSEDKRTSSGWYFKQNINSKYIVGYFPAKDDFKTEEYLDIITACATFIKREIEDIRRS